MWAWCGYLLSIYERQPNALFIKSNKYYSNKTKIIALKMHLAAKSRKKYTAKCRLHNVACASYCWWCCCCCTFTIFGICVLLLCYCNSCAVVAVANSGDLVASVPHLAVETENFYCFNKLRVGKSFLCF